VIVRVYLSDALYALALPRAGNEDAIKAQARRLLETWATGQTAQALGGKARSARLTPARRTEIARAAGIALQDAKRRQRETARDDDAMPEGARGTERETH